MAAGNSLDNKYVQSVRLDGRELDRMWLRHADNAAGGTRELPMGDTPNRSLGAESATFPPAPMDSPAGRYAVS